MNFTSFHMFMTSKMNSGQSPYPIYKLRNLKKEQKYILVSRLQIRMKKRYAPIEGIQRKQTALGKIIQKYIYII